MAEISREALLKTIENLTVALEANQARRTGRVKKAFDMIANAHTITLLSLDEMERIVNRALEGEFD